MSYDYTVLAGTQGMRNHAKTDRVFDLAARKRLPVVLFAEGGGGRPGDTDVGGMAGLDVPTFRMLAGLSGRVPLVSIVSGRCFAGNAALAGVCDVIIATPDANIGMGGPAMIEGGGLGVYPPEAIGPIDVQRRNGVVSLVARDEAHAVSLAKQYLSYFQGSVRRVGRRRIRGWPDMWCRRTGYAPTTCAGRSSRSSTSAPSWSCAPTTVSASSPRWFVSKAWRTA